MNHVERTWKFVLRQRLRDHPPLLHAREPLIQPLMREAEARVIDAHEMQDRGVEIVAPGDVHGGFVAEFIAGAVGGSGLDAGAGEPGDEAAAVVIAARAGLGTSRLGSAGSTS